MAAPIASTSLAAPHHLETLTDAITFAYDANPGLQAQRAAQRALDESYVQARAGYGLNISATVSGDNYDDTRTGSAIDGGGRFNEKTSSYDFAFVQPLYTGGRVHSRVNEAEAQILGGRAALRRYEIDLLQRVVTAYIDLLRDQQILHINADTVTVLEKEGQDTLARFAQHEVTRTDVEQSNARLAQAQTQLSNARAQLAIGRANYVAVIGQPPGELAPPPPLDALPATIDQALDAAEANNPLLAQARFTEQSSRSRVAEAKAGVLPTITARFDLQRAPFAPYLSKPYDAVRSTTVTLTQPLFTSGQIASSIRQTIEENSRDRLSIDDTRLQVIQGVSTAWEQLNAARHQMDSLEREMKADEFAFYGVRQEQKFALRTTIEVLNAELELTNAQQSLATARANEYIDRVQLLALAGILTPQLLAAKVTTYDPAAHFREVHALGSTPLEAPVRILDALAGPHTPAEAPASLAEGRPGGSAMAPTPGPQAPITSILTVADTRPAGSDALSLTTTPKKGLLGSDAPISTSPNN